MKPLVPMVVVCFAGASIAVCHDAIAQMQMRQPMPMVPQTNLFPREFLTEEQWINAIVDHWPGSQRKSWRSLDRHFSGWVSHLVWRRKTMGRMSGEVNAQGPQLPSACPVEAFVGPAHSVTESMNHFRELMPDVGWSAWANIDPAFRTVAEWEMSIEHYRAEVSKTLKDWWALNGGAVRECLNAAQGERDGSTAAAATVPVAASSNPRYAQIERRARSERSAIDHMVAPEPIKKEARDQVDDAAVVDRYSAELEERQP